MNYIIAQKTVKKFTDDIGFHMSIVSITGEFDQLENAASLARALSVYLNDLVLVAGKEAENDSKGID